jgi:hypothetical protein
MARTCSAEAVPSRPAAAAALPTNRPGDSPWPEKYSSRLRAIWSAVAGLVTGALALVIGLFFAASIGAFFATNVNDFRQFGSCLDGARGDQARQACAEQLERNLDR